MALLTDRLRFAGRKVRARLPGFEAPQVGLAARGRHPAGHREGAGGGEQGPDHQVELQHPLLLNNGTRWTGGPQG